MQQLAVGYVVEVGGGAIGSHRAADPQGLHLPTDGIWNATTIVTGAEMEGEFGTKVSREYKLSGCSEAHQCDCCQWFLESLWM